VTILARLYSLAKIFITGLRYTFHPRDIGMLQVQLHSSCLHESYNVTSLALMNHANVTSAAAFLLLARTIQVLLVQLLSYCSCEPYKCYLCGCISLACTNHTYVTSAAAFPLLARTIQMLLVQLLSYCSCEPYKCYLCSCISLACKNHTNVTGAAAFLLLS